MREKSAWRDKMGDVTPLLNGCQTGIFRDAPSLPAASGGSVFPAFSMMKATSPAAQPRNCLR